MAEQPLRRTHCHWRTAWASLEVCTVSPWRYAIPIPNEGAMGRRLPRHWRPLAEQPFRRVAGGPFS